MLKLICFALFSMAGILFYALPVPGQEVSKAAQIRLQDRLFLAELEAQKNPGNQPAAPADRDFLATLEENHIPAAVPTKRAVALTASRPVQVSSQMEADGIPVRRAIPVERALSVPASLPVRAAQPTAASTTIGKRASLAQAAITQIEPSSSATTRSSQRASILIYRGQVVVTRGAVQ
jgi:hypothetical protein